MSKQNIIRISLVSLTIIFNFFFWGEKLGINLLIFTTLLYTALFFTERESFKSKNVIYSFLATIVLALCVVYNNSLFAKFFFFSSFIASVGFIHQQELKAVFFSVATAFSSLTMFPLNFVEELKVIFNRNKKVKKYASFALLSVVPVAVLLLFYAIYYNANPIFAEASQRFWSFARDIIDYIYNNFPFIRLVFICLGIFLLTGILYNRKISLFTNLEARLKDIMQKKEKENFVGEIISTQNFFWTGIILLVLVNLLILIVNFIDIRYYWFGFEYYEGFDLRQFVHEGTYLLVYSILLSMAILLFLFKGRLNFFGGDRTLKRLAYLWIIQNGIMAVSVGVRNYYYIYYSHSLAYKRIGLIIFLIVTFIGLITLYFKIKDKWTFYKLLKVNSAAAYAVFVIFSFVNWGKVIAEFNLSAPDKDMIHYEFMLELSDYALPVLDANKNLLNRNISPEYRTWSHTNALDIFEERKKEFLKDQEEYSWLSWNYADYTVNEYFSNKK